MFLNANLPREELPESPYKCELLGLNLLCLLSQNRVSEFHTEVINIIILLSMKL